MFDWLSTALAFIVILGILVFFHELGHFSAAKALGLQVQEFAFGFGPRLIRVLKRRETEYTIRAIPLGGFVRMPGMEPGEDIEGGFNSQPIWKRALVVVAGPLASFLLGYLVFIFMGVTIGFPPENAKPQPVVGIVQPGMPADTIGLKSGDRLVEIEGTKITRADQMLEIIHGSPKKPLEIVIKRNDEILTLKGTPEPKLSPVFEREVGIIQAGSTAYKAGLRSGDLITQINGKPITKDEQVYPAIHKDNKKPVTLLVKRDGTTAQVTAKPEDLQETIGLLGFVPDIPTERVGIIRSIQLGTRVTTAYMRELVATFTSASKLSKNVGGVVAIARITEKTTQAGPEALLFQIAALSLSLAFINLIPLPILDGGHLLFLLVERLRGGRKLTPEQQAAISSMGLALLVFLAVLLIYVDIHRWVAGTPMQ